MCERAQLCRGTCCRPIDATHKGFMLPVILEMPQPSAEAHCGLVYAFGGDLKASVRSQIEVTDRDLLSEAFQYAVGLEIRCICRNRYEGQQRDQDRSRMSDPRTRAMGTVGMRVHVTSPVLFTTCDVRSERSLFLGIIQRGQTAVAGLPGPEDRLNAG